MSSQLQELKGIQFLLGSFAGGVNVRDAINSLAPDELRRGENLVLDERGSGAKRLGCTSQGVFDPVNMLPNPGFEVNTTGWGVNSGTLTRVTSGQRTGAGAGQGVAAGGTGNYYYSDGTISGATAGRRFTASFWIKGTGAAIGKTATAFMSEAGGAQGEDTTGTHADQSIVLTGSYQKLTCSRTITQNDRTIVRVYVQQQVGAVNGDTITFDDAEIVDTGTRILSAYTFYRVGTTPQVLIHTSTGKLFYTNDPAANPITWVQITTGLSTTVPMGFETFNAKCYMGDGVSNYASWDGTTYTTFASAPKGRLLRVWKDTMWVSGIPGFPDRTYSSNPGDAETFGVSAWIDMGKGDGDSSVALATDGFFLIFSKREKIYVVYDPVTFANRIADPEKGSESHFSWVHFDAQLYFISRRGVCQWRGDAPAIPISLKVDPIFQPSILNLNALSNVYGYAYENRIGWALPEVGQVLPTFQLEYYPRLIPKAGQFGPFMFQRMPASVFVKVRSASSERLYAAHNNSNEFLWLFSTSGTDAGVTFQSLMETGMIDLGARDRTKYIRRIRILGRGKFQLQVLRNFETGSYRTFNVDLTAGSADVWGGGDTWGGTWGPASIILEKLVNTDLYGRYFAFRFLDAEVGVGSQPLSVGSKDYVLTAGEWAAYGALVDGEVLGVRS